MYDKNTAAHNGVQQASGIIWTATTILNRTNQAKEALPVSVAGALGEMLTNARHRLLDTREESKMGDLSAVEHILKVARQENVQVSPTISGALTDILVGFTEGMLKDPAVMSGGPRCGSKCGHGCGGLCTHDNPEAQHVVTLPLTDPELNRLGVDEIELWSLPAGTPGTGSPFNAELKVKLLKLLKRVRTMKEKVNDELDRKKEQAASRVPDWRDGASTAEAVPGSGSLRNATGTAEEACGQEKPEEKPGKSKDTRRRHDMVTSAYYTPDEAEELIEKIRAWLGNCNKGHRLSDLMEAIKAEFELSDGELGELLDIQSRLICNVRHGRPSPSVMARFTEVFGHAGGAKED